jgi:hypothetical protein
LNSNADDARRPVRFALPQKEHLGTQRESACSLVHEHVGPRFDRGYYPFVAGTTSDDVRSALGRCPELRQENATFWNWISPEKPARILGKQKLPLKSQAFISTLGDGSLVLGGLELEDKGVGVVGKFASAIRPGARATIQDARVIGGTAFGQDAIRRTAHGITE